MYHEDIQNKICSSCTIKNREVDMLHTANGKIILIQSAGFFLQLLSQLKII